GLSALVLPYVQTAKLLIAITKNLMLAYSLLTIPFMAVFALALALSNVKLVQHEGKCLTNMLGIGIAVLLAVGTAVNILLFIKAYGTHTIAFTVIYAIYSAGFAIFQVLLTGSIITCLRAASRKIPYDKDYIIILGCAIRKDGTLYPLIQGRVDRAIDFWNKQYQATGRKAIFVPSGGQGDDEIIAEARAMERYLLEKGIPQEYILAEDRSTTTHENMTFSKKLIDARTEEASIAFSTTNYHVFRGGLLAQEAGIKADGIGAHTKWYFWPNAMIREVVGVFSRQSKGQWLFIVGLILLSGLAGYAYTLLY
ncbi:MAG: YdcF family protein, partial [Oscillospiraceae bacterium]|nr:YdcF family protein [Oscillospiraceae bacterium]